MTMNSLHPMEVVRETVSSKLPNEEERRILSMIRFCGLKSPMENLDLKTLKTLVQKRMAEKGHNNIDLAIALGLSGGNKQLSVQGSRVLANLEKGELNVSTLTKLLQYAGIFCLPLTQEQKDAWEPFFAKEEEAEKDKD